LFFNEVILMPREKELYCDTLERIRKRADEKFPDKLLYNQQEAAKIMGVSTKTLQRKGLSEFITAEQLAREFA
jgi:predicted DNA-binding protein (UPF0251 family)